MNGESARKKSITAFRHVFYERCGFDIPDPDEGSLDDEERGRWDAMCSALDAYEAALRERGYAILPVEATEEMIEAGDDAPWAQDCFTTSEIYRAMTAAYLKKD